MAYHENVIRERALAFSRLARFLLFTPTGTAQTWAEHIAPTVEN